MGRKKLKVSRLRDHRHHDTHDVGTCVADGPVHNDTPIAIRRKAVVAADPPPCKATSLGERFPPIVNDTIERMPVGVIMVVVRVCQVIFAHDDAAHNKASENVVF